MTEPGRRLEWKVMEIVPWGVPQADGAVLLRYPDGYSWPVAPVSRLMPIAPMAADIANSPVCSQNPSR